MAHHEVVSPANAPLLSILITAYNRASFLAQCLDSIKNILLPYKDFIEVIVFDNGSQDNTLEILRQYEKTIPITILHEDENKLFQYGVLTCIAHAKGEYCWILGDDDFILGAGMIDVIRKRDADIFIMNHAFYISEHGKYKYLNLENNNFLLKKQQDIYVTWQDYLFGIRHPNGFFLHIAPVVFRRSLWNMYASPDILKRHAISESIHVYIFLKILRETGRIRYISTKTVAIRVGAPPQEWLTEKGRYHAISLNTIYITDMVRDVFTEPLVIRHFKDITLKKSILILLLGSKLRCRFAFQFYARLLRFLYSHYKTHPFFWYGIIPVLFIPRSVFALLYRLFMGIK